MSRSRLFRAVVVGWLGIQMLCAGLNEAQASVGKGFVVREGESYYRYWIAIGKRAKAAAPDSFRQIYADKLAEQTRDLRGWKVFDTNIPALNYLLHPNELMSGFARFRVKTHRSWYAAELPETEALEFPEEHEALLVRVSCDSLATCVNFPVHIGRYALVESAHPDPAVALLLSQYFVSRNVSIYEYEASYALPRSFWNTRSYSDPKNLLDHQLRLDVPTIERLQGQELPAYGGLYVPKELQSLEVLSFDLLQRYRRQIAHEWPEVSVAGHDTVSPDPKEYDKYAQFLEGIGERLGLGEPGLIDSMVLGRQLRAPAPFIEALSNQPLEELSIALHHLVLDLVKTSTESAAQKEFLRIEGEATAVLNDLGETLFKAIGARNLEEYQRVVRRGDAAVDKKFEELAAQEELIRKFQCSSRHMVVESLCTLDPEQADLLTAAGWVIEDKHGRRWE